MSDLIRPLIREDREPIRRLLVETGVFTQEEVGIAMSHGVDGVCPTCGTKVTTYTKQGAWCSKCREMVTAWNSQTHPFLCQGELV